MRADKTTVHNKVFMFLSSDDVSDKYIVTKTIQKTAIEYDLSLNVNTDCVYNKYFQNKLSRMCLLKRKQNGNNCCTALLKCQYIEIFIVN